MTCSDTSGDARRVQGVASDEARAATASRPSPAVLGQAGIANAERIEMPGADVVIIRQANIGLDADQAFASLRHSLPWKQRSVFIAGRDIPQPRLTSWHADEGVHYTYSGRTHLAQRWTPVLVAIRDAVSALAGEEFNSVLLNLYPDERASIGFHSDDEPELGPEPVIASVSLGAERLFEFRPKGGGRTIKISLRHGDVLIMRGTTQLYWQHGIRKSRDRCGERINLTFRRTAKAIEARRAETGTGSVEDESAARQGLPETDIPSSNDGEKG